MKVIILRHSHKPDVDSLPDNSGRAGGSTELGGDRIGATRESVLVAVQELKLQPVVARTRRLSISSAQGGHFSTVNSFE
eukprot:CAMPEP_0172896074 /NCGR_PEP_ID=MMETSP1075-20121228/154663_1 /TAXON_ID=2916 /ORGANISM="Ceratium fusus, Strain PA161109" /LENGTH=78 /DNA_ID=CAMNT_0013751419 /DNA_START=33 /DNA_END=266 /DNA_ORIENTATION=+